MILNYIWISLILLAILMGLVQAICYGNVDIFSAILNSTFDSAKTGFELSLGLTGVLALWMGIMKIGEQAGAVNTLGKAINPFFSRIFPDIPKGHPVYGSMLMNFAANMLGLDNAATPMGLKAMGELQELNTDKTKASNAMIMFVVLGASGLTLIPTTIMAYRAQLGAANPADVFLPILIATYYRAENQAQRPGSYRHISRFDSPGRFAGMGSNIAESTCLIGGIGSGSGDLIVRRNLLVRDPGNV